MKPQELAQQALALSLADRVSLAEALWSSIGHELETATEKEAVDQAINRDHELTSGAVSGLTRDEVMKAAHRGILSII